MYQCTECNKTFEDSALENNFLICSECSGRLALVETHDKTRTAMNKPKGFVYVFLIIALVIGVKYVAGIMGKNSAQEVNRREAENASVSSTTTDIPPIQAIKTIQPSQGFTEKDFDDTVLANFEGWLLEMSKEKYKSNLIKQGITPNEKDLEFQTKAHFVFFDNKKLAVINMANDYVCYNFVIGFNGDEMIRVSCYRASKQDFSAFSGVCGEEVANTFGITIK